MNLDNDRWVRSDDARNRLSELLREVQEDDAHIFVLRYDKPVAVLVPVGWREEMMTLVSSLGSWAAGGPAVIDQEAQG